MSAILLKYQFPDDYIDEIYDSALSLSCIMLKNGQTYFEVFWPYFNIMHKRIEPFFSRDHW